MLFSTFNSQVWIIHEKKICWTRSNWAILIKVEIWNVLEMEITRGNCRQGEVTSPAQGELRSSLVSTPLVQGCTMASDQSQTRTKTLRRTSSALSTETHSSPQTPKGVWPKVLLSCIAGRHRRSYFLFHLQCGSVDLSWLYFRTPWGMFTNSGCPEPTPDQLTKSLGVGPVPQSF